MSVQEFASFHKIKRKKNWGKLTRRVRNSGVFGDLEASNQAWNTRDVVFFVLVLKPESRPEERIKKLAWSLHTELSFFRELSFDNCTKLCRDMTMRSFEADEVVRKQKYDSDDIFFVISKGSVEVVVKNQPKPLHQLTPQEIVKSKIVVHKFGEGDVIEFEIESNAELRTSEKTILLGINAELFSEMRNVSKEKTREKASFMKERVWYFRDYSMKRLDRMCSLSEIQEFERNKVLVREGSNDPNIWFLFSGKCRLLKKFGDTVVEIGTFNAGDLWGDLETEKPKPLPYSVCSISIVRCLVIGKQDFMDYITPATALTIRQHLRHTNVSRRRISTELGRNRQWARYKEGVLGGLLADRNVRRRGMQFRSASAPGFELSTDVKIPTHIRRREEARIGSDRVLRYCLTPRRLRNINSAADGYRNIEKVIGSASQPRRRRVTKYLRHSKSEGLIITARKPILLSLARTQSSTSFTREFQHRRVSLFQ
eukprot:158813_1